MNTRARVLLLEDDVPIRQFVEMALEELPVDLVMCSNVADALAALAGPPVALIITDLMLRGESGIDFVNRLNAQPQLRRDAAIAVFSAGINVQVRRTLEEQGVSTFLHKPATLAEIESCVVAAVSAFNGGGPAAASAPIVHGGGDGRSAAISRNFGGDADLYDQFAASCAARFKDDIAAGDKALAEHDAPALRQVTHSLKTVLQLLGYADLSSQASQIEVICEGTQGRIPPISETLWHALTGGLTRLHESQSSLDAAAADRPDSGDNAS